VVASYIFRHIGVGVVTSGIIQMLPKMQAPTKLLSKTELFPKNHSEPIFISPVAFFIKTSESLVNNLSLLILSEP